jgi:hypothetical protein
MYTLMVLLFSLALLGLVMALRCERGGWTIYAAATALVTLTQGLGIVYALLLASTFWILAPDPIRSGLWRRWAGATALALLPFAFWLPIYLSRVAWVAEAYWIMLDSPWPPSWIPSGSSRSPRSPSPTRYCSPLGWGAREIGWDAGSGCCPLSARWASWRWGIGG